MTVTVNAASDELVLATQDLKELKLTTTASNDSLSSDGSIASSTVASEPTVEPDNDDASISSARPCIKSNYSIDDIPLALHKSSFKCLPKPDMSSLRKTRAISCESYFTDKQQKQQKRRGVSFKDVTVRKYDLTLGDHPCVSYGFPISLDWGFEEMEPIDLESYESDRQPQRRSMRQLVLSHYQRKNILLHTYGHSKEELQAASKQVKTAQRQRALTKYWLKLSKVEEAAESARRKAKRAVKSS